MAACATAAAGSRVKIKKKQKKKVKEQEKRERINETIKEEGESEKKWKEVREKKMADIFYFRSRVFFFLFFFFHFIFLFFVFFGWWFCFVRISFFIYPEEREKKNSFVLQRCCHHTACTLPISTFETFRELGRLVFDQLWFSFSFRVGLRARGIGGGGECLTTIHHRIGKKKNVVKRIWGIEGKNNFVDFFAWKRGKCF